MVKLKLYNKKVVELNKTLPVCLYRKEDENNMVYVTTSGRDWEEPLRSDPLMSSNKGRDYPIYFRQIDGDVIIQTRQFMTNSVTVKEKGKTTTISPGGRVRVSSDATVEIMKPIVKVIFPGSSAERANRQKQRNNY